MCLSSIVAVRRKTEREQARWVRRIFAWRPEGRPPRWIAAELNRLGVPSPRRRTWAQSAIYGDMSKGTGLLSNELYVGRFVWNRSRWVKDPDLGKAKRIPRVGVDSRPNCRSCASCRRSCGIR